MMKSFTRAGLKPACVRRTYLKVRTQFHHIYHVIFFAYCLIETAPPCKESHVGAVQRLLVLSSFLTYPNCQRTQSLDTRSRLSGANLLPLSHPTLNNASFEKSVE